MKKDRVSNNKFGSTLAELRKDKSLTQVDFSKILNISSGTYGHYEEGRSCPHVDMIVEIAKYFDLSVDYLLGLCPYKKGYIAMSEVFSGEMTYVDLFKRLAELDEKDREFLCYFLEKLR